MTENKKNCNHKTQDLLKIPFSAEIIKGEVELTRHCFLLLLEIKSFFNQNEKFHRLRLVVF